MSKYKDVFNARKLENGNSINEENLTKIEVKENRKEIKPEIQKSGKPDKLTLKKSIPDKQVNLGIKVAESRRRHWVGQAKLQGITVSEIIISALSKKFGEPD